MVPQKTYPTLSFLIVYNTLYLSKRSQDTKYCKQVSWKTCTLVFHHIKINVTYRVTHQLVPNLPLTWRWDLRRRARQVETLCTRRNSHFDVNGRFGKSWWVTLYSYVYLVPSDCPWQESPRAGPSRCRTGPLALASGGRLTHRKGLGRLTTWIIICCNVQKWNFCVY